MTWLYDVRPNIEMEEAESSSRDKKIQNYNEGRQSLIMISK